MVVRVGKLLASYEHVREGAASVTHKIWRPALAVWAEQVVTWAKNSGAVS
jgi:hypothetical protein